MKDEITVVACHPGKPAVITSISSSLENMQQFVGGTIQAIYPFDDPVCIVCNDAAKLLGMAPCRALYAPFGGMYDIVCGSFFIADASGEDFGPLSHEMQEKYQKLFKEAEVFIRAGNSIHAIKIPDPPEKSHKISHRH